MTDPDPDRIDEQLGFNEVEDAATLMGTVKTPEDAVALLLREVGPDRPIGSAAPYITGWLKAMLTGDYLKGYDEGYGHGLLKRDHAYRDSWPRWTPRRTS